MFPSSSDQHTRSLMYWEQKSIWHPSVLLLYGELSHFVYIKISHSLLLFQKLLFQPERWTSNTFKWILTAGKAKKDGRMYMNIGVPFQVLGFGIDFKTSVIILTTRFCKSSQDYWNKRSITSDDTYRTKIFDTLLLKLWSRTSIKVHFFPSSNIKPASLRVWDQLWKMSFLEQGWLFHMQIFNFKKIYQ